MRKGYVRQKDVAAELGLHVTTVSKSLLGNPKVSAKTRERVRRKAAELGYRPDPALRALASYRSRDKRKPVRACLGWIVKQRPDCEMERFAAYANYWEGAVARAEALGYRLETFRVEQGGMSEERLTDILRARGIAGCVVAPMDTPGGSLRLNWEELSAVAIGYTLAEPELCRVTNDHFQTMTRLLEALNAEGRARIGLYLWGEDNRRVGKRAASAFQAWSERRGVPVVEYEKADRESFLGWVERHGLDAVVTRKVETKDWLAEAGYSVPGDVKLVSYAWEAGVPYPGMDHNNGAIGAAAVDWVARMVERGRRGIPGLPESLLVGASWIDPGGRRR